MMLGARSRVGPEEADHVGAVQEHTPAVVVLDRSPHFESRLVVNTGDICKCRARLLSGSRIRTPRYNRGVFRPIFFTIAAVAGVAAAAGIAARGGLGAASTDTPPGILLSRQVIEQEHLRVGDLVTLSADSAGTRSARFRVEGVYEPTPDPAKFSRKRLEARLHLPDLIALTADAADSAAADSVDAINLAVAHPADIQPVISAIVARVPGIVVRETSSNEGSSDVFAIVERFHWAIALVTMAGSTAFLLALMVIRAEERREVVGILRLIGIGSRSIALEIVIEGLVIGAAGAAFGLVVAFAGQAAVNRYFQWRYDTALVFVRITPRIIAQAVALALPLGVAAGVVASATLLGRNIVALVRR